MQDVKHDRCRICLSTHNLTGLVTGKTSPTVEEKIVYCTAIQISSEESLPSKICTKCEFYLNVAYVFKTVCEWTDFKLQQEVIEPKEVTHATQDVSNNIQQVQNTRVLKITQLNNLCLEQQNRDHSIHLIDLLLMQKYLETFKYFSCKRSEVELIEQALRDTFSKQDEDCIHCSGNECLNDDREINNDSLNMIVRNADPSEDTNLSNQTEFTVRNADSVNKQIMNERLDLESETIQPNHFTGVGFNYSNSVDEINNEPDSIDQGNTLGNEEFVLQYEKKEDNIIHSSKNELLIVKNKPSVIECNCLIDDDPLSIQENGLAEDIPSLDSEESDSECSVINKEPNLINRAHLSNDPDNAWSVYKKVCLYTQDPLLPKVNTLENDDLKNLESSFHLQNETESPEKSTNAKHVSLANISLRDFENFEKEHVESALLDNDMVQNDHSRSDTQTSDQISAKKLVIQSENRVGRHIAKKNAGQPPKRYSPTPETAKHPTNLSHSLKQNIIKDDSPIGPKPVEEKLEKKTELRNMDSILDQNYVFEGDLSMPVPIFEETIVTDGFYLVNDDEETFLGNFDDQQVTAEIRKDVPEENRRNGKGSARIKPKKKVNVFTDQTVTKRVLPKCHTEANSNKLNYIRTKFQNDIHQSSDESDEEISNSSDCDNFGINKINKNKVKSHGNSDNKNQEIFQPSYVKHKQVTKKRRNKRTGSSTTCKVCNKSFPFPSHLQRHLTAHIGVKRFTCMYCNKEFLHRYNLSVHMRSHTGNFPLQCEICNRGFASPSVLERHKRSHTGETPFQCQYCLQLFSHASSLNMHQKMHLNRPSFSCDICYKVFSYKSSLNAHRKGHSGFKQHSCSICHKRFTRRTSVMRHMSCHVEAKRFKCRTCGEVLNSKKSLVKHRKMHSSVLI